MPFIVLAALCAWLLPVAALAQTTEDDSRTRLNLVDTLVALKNTTEAETLVSGVLSREPKNPEALGAKGRLLLAEGRTNEAIEVLTQATATPATEPRVSDSWPCQCRMSSVNTGPQARMSELEKAVDQWMP